MEVITKTRLKCPECGFVQELEMPTNAYFSTNVPIASPY